MGPDFPEKRSSRDDTNEESISILDPRRFTPTLHANLVSEILALRRDQDEKIRQIESLETALLSVKEEHEHLQENLIISSKENRSLKRQISLLEDGTASAMGELARQRDEAVDSVAETKKRLESAQKKIRDQEDDSQRVHELLVQEKDQWEDERRKYERKLHIAESRLRMILDEVAVHQSRRMSVGPATQLPEDQVGGEDSDTESNRTRSLTSSIRHSLLNGPVLHPGNSLADELNFDDDDRTDADGRESVLSQHSSPKHVRSCSRESGAGRFRHVNYSTEGLRRSGCVARSRLFMNPAVWEALEGEDGAPVVSQMIRGKHYVDAGVQYSRPPSPEVPRCKSPTTETSGQCIKTTESDSLVRADPEVEANQRRKRVHLSRALTIEPPKAGNRMISTSAQTSDLPMSPPKTPQSPIPDLDGPTHKSVPMVTASTQTEEAAAVLRASVDNSFSRPTPSPPPLEIPTISIQPPTSRPMTPGEIRLPQHFKQFGCQVNLSYAVPMSDASVQTEGIHVDKRLALLPPHLQPSAISSRPTSPNTFRATPDHDSASISAKVPPRNPRRVRNSLDQDDFPSSPVTSLKSYLTQADDLESSSKGGGTAARRMNHNLSSIFAGFDTASSDEGDVFGDLDRSDAEFPTALSAPRPPPVSAGVIKRGSLGTATCAEQAGPKFGVLNSDKETQDEGHSQGLSRTYGRATAPAPPSPPGCADLDSAIRKASVIQNGICCQQSPPIGSSPVDGQCPPYPIPNRESSRRSQIGLNSPSEGQASPTGRQPWHRRGGSRSSHQCHSVRKARSAAALPRAPRQRRHGSLSPPPLSPSTEAPETPCLAPLARNDTTTTPRNGRERGQLSYRRHRHELSTNTDKTNTTAPTACTSASHPTGVVDAIAQTMVGEWMLKYVRRRKSFSVAESNGKDDSSNDRHKRWVWLAPYERSILWSSRQPSSGSALLGKTGRKLLDVKDDNVAPKVMPLVFNRSILILTPQRALKFTASSAERHYLWLMALSFLAHSTQAVPGMISAPQASIGQQQQQQQQQKLPEFEPPRLKVSRGGIRDSILLAKGRKTLASRGGSSNVPSSNGVHSSSSRASEATSSRMMADSGSAASCGHSREQSREAAEAPFIPRFPERSAQAVATHGRKRSNTGGHVAPPLSFRGFSGPAGSGSSGPSTGNGSVDTAMSSDAYQTHGSSSTTWWNMSQMASQRTSEASSRPGNFFEAIGTIRMEAFINPLAHHQEKGSADERSDGRRSSTRRRYRHARRRYTRSQPRDSGSYKIANGGELHHDSARQQQAAEDGMLGNDPFKGF
ncbi:hypothetical protein UVI_02034230 [Ustilaginoidea virens]|uniref:Pleckstrin homology domain-containing protein n=1 Tax=Ustilaginoidea virens TaxID=1159556 RepID=A0A1B5KTY4_USTVR|nr:hypothetical protein UVI_02034230 [Ustilaginoidea virens]